MKMNLIQECIDCLNAADVDREEDQKLISVCESYLLHSYDLYSDFCLNEGYEPVEAKDYMNQLLALNEGRFIRKMLGLAAAGAAAYGGAKVVRANQAYRAANGISSGQNASFTDRVKSNLKSTGQMIQQSAGTGNNALDKGKSVYNNVVRGTKVFGKDARDTNTAQWKNGNITQTTDSSGRQTVKYQKGNNEQVQANQGTKVTVQRTDGNGNVSQTRTKTLNPNTSASIVTDKMQQNAQAHNNPLSKAGEQAYARKKEAGVQAEQAYKTAIDNGDNEKAERIKQGREKVLKREEERNKQNPQQNTQQQTTNESYSYIAKNFKEPLTPSIRMPKKFI